MSSNFEDDYFYHYDRELSELELASAQDSVAASLHRDLANLHRARRESINFVESLAAGRSADAPGGIDRTDKEC